VSYLSFSVHDSLTPHLSHQIQQLEAEASRLTEALSKSRTDKAAAQRGLEAARKQVKQLRHSFEKARVATESLSEQVEQLEERVAVLEAEATPTAEETTEAASLARQLAALDAEMERKSPALKTLEAEVTRRQKEILEVGGPKLKAAQARVDAVTKELEGMQTLCSAKEVELAAAVKTQTRAAAAVAKGEKELAVLVEQLESMQSEQKSAEEEALQVISAVEAAKALMAEQEAQLATIREKYEAVAAEVEKTRSGIVDIETHVEDFQRVLSESTGRAAYWAKELAGVRKAWAEDQAEELRRVEMFEAAEKEAGVYVEAAVVGASAAAAVAVVEETEDKVEMDKTANAATEAAMEDLQPAAASEDMLEGAGEEADAVAVKEEFDSTADADADTEKGDEAVAMVAAVTPERGLADLPIFTEDNIGGISTKQLEDLRKSVAADEKARDALKVPAPPSLPRSLPPSLPPSLAPSLLPSLALFYTYANTCTANKHPLRIPYHPIRRM
jgi:chromosome segregation ATPase